MLQQVKHQMLHARGVFYYIKAVSLSSTAIPDPTLAGHHRALKVLHAWQVESRAGLVL